MPALGAGGDTGGIAGPDGTLATSPRNRQSRDRMPAFSPVRRHLTTLLALLVVVLAPAASAHAAPVALTKSDVPGAKPGAGNAKTMRAALLAAMRGGPRGAVKRAPAAASGFRAGTTVILTGSVQLLSESSARAALKAAKPRTSVGRRSSATASVQVGKLVGFVSVTTAAHDKTVRRAADAYARTLRSRLAGAQTTVAERLAEDGDYSKSEALALFQIVYGGMPGAKVPAGTRGSVDDGTAAGSRVFRLLDQLSPAQQAAFRAAIDDGPAPATPARRAGAARAAKKPKKSTLTPDPTWQTVGETYVATYATGPYLARALPFPIKVFKSSKSIDATADSYPVDAAGKLAQTGPAYCRIRLDPKFYGKPETFKYFVLAHEVFHCFEFSITTDWGYKARDWVIEGMADWAASRVVNDTSSFGASSFAGYLFKPDRPLFAKSYGASGFWGHINERLGNFWPRVAATLQGGPNPATYDIAGGSEEDVRVTMASRYLRDPGAGSAWTTSQPFPITDAEAHTPRAVSSAAAATITTPAYTQKLVDLLPTPKLPVVQVNRGGGNVRFTDGGFDFTDRETQYFCMGAVCECPPNETGSFPSPMSTVNSLTAALAGEKSGGQLAITRRPIKDFCKKDKDPPKLGDGGAGGSNGDPHLTSLDGLRFDFQAAGEFLLARSGSDLEVQARQEPWKLGKTVIRSVTLNTQFAIKVGTVRATFGPGTTPQLRVNGGAPHALAAGSKEAIGTGNATSDGDKITVSWPDGSQATVWSVGEWGVAVSLDLAPARQGTTTGLLGNFNASPSDDLRTRGGKVVAFKAAAALWPGVERVSIDDPTDPKFADKLYDDVGDSWRLSQKESLLDYAAGQSTKTFTDKSIPRQLVEAADLSDSKRASAEAACRAAGVTAPTALEDCILDVGLTGQTAFAAAAAKEETLTAIGWTRLAAGGNRRSPVSLARTGDGTLQLVWDDENAPGKRAVVAAGLPAAGGERAPVTVAPFDTTPFAFTAPDGGLRMVGSVIDSGPPVTEGIVHFAAGAPYDSWSALAQVVSPGAYVGEPMSTFVGDKMLTVSGLNGGGKVYLGTGNPGGSGLPLNGALSADCYAMKPAIATTSGETYAAWWQWDCPQTGLYVAPIDPATGKPGDEIAVPQSVWSTPGLGALTWDAPGLDRLSLAARPGGGVFLAYARQDDDTWSVLLWRIGSPTPTTVASGLRQRPDALQVSAEPTTGNLWVAYESQDAAFGKGHLTARRTNAAADGWAGSPRTIAFPTDGDQRAAPSHPWDVLARDGALDVIAGYPATSEYPGALWHGVVGG